MKNMQSNVMPPVVGISFILLTTIVVSVACMQCDTAHQCNASPQQETHALVDSLSSSVDRLKTSVEQIRENAAKLREKSERAHADMQTLEKSVNDLKSDVRKINDRVEICEDSIASFDATLYDLFE